MFVFPQIPQPRYLGFGAQGALLSSLLANIGISCVRSLYGDYYNRYCCVSSGANLADICLVLIYMINRYICSTVFLSAVAHSYSMSLY